MINFFVTAIVNLKYILKLREHNKSVKMRYYSIHSKTVGLPTAIAKENNKLKGRLRELEINIETLKIKKEDVEKTFKEVSARKNNVIDDYKKKNTLLTEELEDLKRKIKRVESYSPQTRNRNKSEDRKISLLENLETNKDFLIYNGIEPNTKEEIYISSYAGIQVNDLQKYGQLNIIKN